MPVAGVFAGGPKVMPRKRSGEEGTFIHSAGSNLVVSSNGYSVETLGVSGMRYINADHNLFVDSESTFGEQSGYVLRKGRISLPTGEVDKIVAYIQRAFDYRQLVLYVLSYCLTAL